MGKNNKTTEHVKSGLLKLTYFSRPTYLLLSKTVLGLGWLDGRRRQPPSGGATTRVDQYVVVVVGKLNVLSQCVINPH